MAGRVAGVVPASWSTVLDEARPLAERFAAAGHRLYLVGGAVRDLVAGRTVDLVDLDFTTDARPAEIRAVLEGSVDALWAQGERFGTVAARVDGRQVEVTTHRSEAYVADSRKPVVAFSDDVAELIAERKKSIAFQLSAMGSPTTNFYYGAYARQGYREEADEVRRLWFDGRKGDAADAVPDDLATTTSLFGTRDIVRDRIRAYRDAGVTSLRLEPVGRTVSDRLDVLAAAVELVREVDAESSEDVAPAP